MFRVSLTRRPAAVLTAVIAVGLGHPATVEAAGTTVPSPGSIQGVVGQAVQQASQTAQSAAAAATAAQTGPVNVAVQIIVSSPGASPVIVQTNGNSAEAKASNASSTEQDAQAAQQGGGGGGSAQGVEQASQTAQGAGAQASAAQASPVNVAIQVVKDSPGASPAIVQTNANQADAEASNQSSTTQHAAAANGDSGAGPGTGSPGPAESVAGVLPPSPPPPAALSAPAPPPSPPTPGQPGLDLGALLGDLPDLAWLWQALATGLPPPLLPSVLELPFPGWPPTGPVRGEDAQTRSDHRAATAARAHRARAGQPATGRDGAVPGLVLPGAPTTLDPASASSSFVQTPARTQKDTSESPLRLPSPALPAPAGGGGGAASAGLLPVALAILALSLSFLGLLFGRLGLASARWRHQAYLAPLQRPG